MTTKTLSERGLKILKVAQALFLEKGYNETSLEMIIAESGGSRRSIYNEFGNKQGLLIAVIKEHIASQVNKLVDIDYQLPPQQALTEVCIRFLNGLLSDTLIALFRLVAHLVPQMPEVGEMIYQNGPLAGCAPIKNYLIYLHNNQDLNVDEPDFAANMLIEMVKSRLHLKAVLVPNEKITQQEVRIHTEKTVALFLKMYTPT